MKNWTLVSPMKEIPVGWRAALRELTLGKDTPWGAWSVTHQDGSCWAALNFTDDGKEETITGWAYLTKEMDMLPVVGVFVDKNYRSSGLGTMLVSTLLNSLLSSDVISRGQTLYCSLHRWPKYRFVIESCGLNCKVWE